VQDAFFHFFSMLLNGAYASKFETGWIFLTIPILVAGTNSVSSGNIVEESFFDKYFAEKLKVPTII
jgi:hypothetical protein